MMGSLTLLLLLLLLLLCCQVVKLKKVFGVQ
jgi:hypothetical protein